VYFDVSKTFQNSNWVSLFLALIFLPENQHQMKKNVRGPAGTKRDQVAQALGLSRHPGLFGDWGSDVIRLSSRLISLTFKVLYKDSLWRSLKEAVEKHETMKQRLYLRRLEGEMLPESRPIASPTFQTSPTPSSWWRGSISPMDYGFVVVSCFLSLLCYDV
jgi:hypothetical protein